MTVRDIAWAVTSGYYSEYRVEAVFSARSLTEAWIEAHGRKGSDNACSLCVGTGFRAATEIRNGVIIPKQCFLCDGTGRHVVEPAAGSEIYDIEEFPFDPPTEVPEC